MKQDQVY